jgi:hypothetical protein
MLDATAPLQLLFDEPLASIKQKFAYLVEMQTDVFVDGSMGSHSAQIYMQRAGIGYVLTWSEGAPALTGYRPIFTDINASAMMTAVSIDFDADVEGGALVPPIAMALLELGQILATSLSSKAVVWNPAKLVADPIFYSDSVAGYAAGGAFPVLACVDFEYDDAQSMLCSTGLSWFADQEMQLSGAGMERSALTRRAVRLVHDVATNGAIIMQQYVPDLDDDKVIELVPDIESKLLRCEIQSKADVNERAGMSH